MRHCLQKSGIVGKHAKNTNLNPLRNAASSAFSSCFLTTYNSSFLRKTLEHALPVAFQIWQLGPWRQLHQRRRFSQQTVPSEGWKCLNKTATSELSAGYLIFYFWLCQVFVATRAFSLAVASRGYSLTAVHGFLIVVAFLVAGHRFQGTRAQQLWHTDLVAPCHVESSLTRYQTHISCIGRWILYH